MSNMNTGEATPIKSAGIYRQAEFRIHQRKPRIEPMWIKRLKKKAIDFVKRTSHPNIGLCLLVDFDAPLGGKDVLDDPSAFISKQSILTSAHKLVVIVDRDGGYVAELVTEWDDAENWDPVWSAHVSEELQAVVFHLSGRSLLIYESGVPMEEIWDVWRPKYPFAPKTARHHLAHEYADLVRQHFEDFVQHHRVIVYWKDRKRRIFVGGPEKIFQRHLWWYLDEFVLDAREVSMERPLGGLTDRTDIWIETIDDRHYVLEIKWLGKSSSGSYDEDRALEGARQTIVYLRRDNRIKLAALVLYDGRNKDEDIRWSPAELDPRLDLSLRLYIESKTASEVAHSG